VKASPEDQQQLLELGRIDTELVKIARQLSALPAATAAEQAEVMLAAARENRRAAQESVDGLAADLVRAESDVELVKKRLEHDNTALNQTTSAKDAQGLEHEIASLTARQSLLEDVQLEVMEKLDAAQGELTAAHDEVTSVEERLADARAEAEAQTAAFEESRRVLRDDRAALTSRLPDDLVALYDKQRERYGFGVSELIGGVSSASGVQLTESDLQTIRQAANDEVVLCPDSNAILVRPR
jgi:predicted  nucleic acid-binding Zn-ribbon protein